MTSVKLSLEIVLGLLLTRVPYLSVTTSYVVTT